MDIEFIGNWVIVRPSDKQKRFFVERIGWFTIRIDKFGEHRLGVVAPVSLNSGTAVVQNGNDGFIIRETFSVFALEFKQRTHPALHCSLYRLYAISSLSSSNSNRDAGSNNKAHNDQGNKHQGGAPNGKCFFERCTHESADVSARRNEVIEWHSKFRTAFAQMQQTGDCHKDQSNADAKATGRETRSSLIVTRTTQQQRTTNNKHRWKEDSKSSDQCTGNLRQAAAERTSEVAVDAEGGQQPKSDERDPPYVMTMTSECFTNWTRRGTASGRRRATLGRSRTSLGRGLLRSRFPSWRLSRR
jgi:hypothetical protein